MHAHAKLINTYRWCFTHWPELNVAVRVNTKNLHSHMSLLTELVFITQGLVLWKCFVVVVVVLIKLVDILFKAHV